MLSKIWLAVIGAGMATTLTIVSACSGAPRAVDPAQASVSRRTESRVVALPPPPVSAARGARPFDWGELRVWLPPAWTPPDYSQTCRSVGFRDLASRYGEPGAVGVELATCKYPRAHGDALSITRRLAAPPAGGHGATINGIPVVEYGRDGIKNAVVDVPSLHAQLTAKTSSAARIVTTLQPSASYDLLHTPGRLALPRSWRQITWHGITLDVPRSWYLDPVGYGPCPSFFGDKYAQAMVIRGPLTSSSGCAGEAFSAIPVTKGSVAIDPGVKVSAIGSTVVEHHGPLTLRLSAIADTPAGINIQITGGRQPSDVELTIGTTPSSPGTIAHVITSIHTRPRLR